MNKQLKVLFIGTCIPKECGIVTFTYNLLTSVTEENNDVNYEVITLNDTSETYDYQEKVVFQIERDKIEDYYRAADFINQSDTNIVCLQHELGLFWWDAENYIFALLSGINKPIITTIYTVIREPEPEYRIYTEKIIDYSEKLIVMSHTAVEILKDVYNAPEEKIEVILHDFDRKMTWQSVGKEYTDVFYKALKEYDTCSRVQNRFNFIPNQLPEVKLGHLKLLTDDVGIIQHTNFGVPARHHGYSTDDVGRALVALTQLINSQAKTEEFWKLITTYMSFLEHAQTDTGHFHNFMSYKREFLDEKGSEDTLGRAIYGLGNVVSCTYLSKNIRTLAHNIVSKSIPEMESLSYPRAKAYTMCGLYEMLRAGIDMDDFGSMFDSRRVSVMSANSLKDKDAFESIFVNHADYLVDLYETNHREDWNWFEPTVTYGNAKLSESLLLAYNYTKDKSYRKIGLATLDFLTDIQWRGDFFDLVGNNGWYSYGGQKPIFDQQPIEAGYLTQAYVSAYEIVRDKRYLELAKYSFEYFLGRNRLRTAMCDYSTGAVCDGFNSDGMSCNQGAEPVICYLMALGSLNKQQISPSVRHSSPG